ncbi:MAG TPA: hypothetical protein VGD57_01095 [Candidatus Dormibacteraeota bacterium]
MPVVQWEVRLGYLVEVRDGELGRVTEIFEGPAASIYVSSEPYMRVRNTGMPDLLIPFSEIVDVSEVKQTVYLKRYLRDVNALRWTRDPRQPEAVAPRYVPRPRVAEALRPDSDGTVGPRPRVESGAWKPGEAAPRTEPGRGIRIGDRFKPGDQIPAQGQYMCTACRFRRHSRQFREENPDGRFPPPHHPGALWELEDLRA